MTAAEQGALQGRTVLLFDGVCGLCNRLVLWLLRADREGRLRFVPLESPLGRELLGRFSMTPDTNDGVVLLTDILTAQERLYRRSDAMSETLVRIGGGQRLLGRLLRLCPRPLREWGYGVVARSRYRLFGQYDACSMPTEAERARILGIGSV
ncbi:MAG TPA: DCC1-like thiol-disulfide oxidoreductase family protein [Granulicella sp.]